MTTTPAPEPSVPADPPSFAPPADFAARAHLNADALSALRAQADRDPESFWAAQARELLLWRRPFSNVVAVAGFNSRAPSGDNGSNLMVKMSLSGWKRLGVLNVGAQLPIDGDRDSSSLFYNIHLDEAFEVSFIPGADYIVPFIELNGMVWLDSGDGSAKVDLKNPPAPAQHVPLRTAQNILYGSGVTATIAILVLFVWLAFYMAVMRTVPSMSLPPSAAGSIREQAIARGSEVSVPSMSAVHSSRVLVRMTAATFSPIAAQLGRSI